MFSHQTPASLGAHDAQVTDWTNRLRHALPDEATYRNGHENFLKEFKKLSDAGQGRDSVSMLNHVAPIYKHIELQGYQAHIHHLPLREAFCNFREGMPVADWKGPPDQFSRSDRNEMELNPTELSPTRTKKGEAANDEQEDEQEEEVAASKGRPKRRRKTTQAGEV